MNNVHSSTATKQFCRLRQCFSGEADRINLAKRFVQTLLLNTRVLLACCSVGSLCAQTSWTINPDTPSNLTSNAKLKFANDSFRLVWQPSSFSNPPQVLSADLGATPDLPMPYSIPVNSTNLGVNPASGTKRLTIRYATSTGEYQAVVQDGNTLTIPSSSHTLVGPAQSVSGFVVVSATYGTTTTFVDVKNVFRVSILPFSPSVFSFFTMSDFTYDGDGTLLLVGSDSYPIIAYPISNLGYRVEEIRSDSSFLSNGSKVCCAYGNGRLAAGLSDISFSSSSNGQSLFHAPSPGNTGFYRYSWSAPFHPTGISVKQMIYGGGKFVAVGSRYDPTYPSSSKGAVLVSADGIEWTTVVITGTTSLESVCHGGGQWVAVGDSGSVLNSPNGFEWTKTTISGAGNLASVAFGNGYCVVGSASGRIYTSTDFSSWNLQNVASSQVSSLAVGEGKFMALVGAQVYQSPFSPVGTADIVGQPASSFTIPQQSASLSVTAVGTGSINYQWYEGVSGNTTQPISGATDASYQTPPLTSNKSYWVRVSNGIGSEDSLTATLTMQNQPVITIQPAGKTFDLGSSVFTSVSVTGNNIAYQWYKGFSGDVSSPLAGMTSSSLTLPSLLPGVSYYWVRVSNTLGSLDSTNLRAEVRAVWPVIVDEPLDAETYRGDYKSISVSAVGQSLSYQWFGGVSGDTSRPIPTTSYSYAPPYNLPGTYQYWVRVSNTIGSMNSRTVQFKVLGAESPIITRQPYDTTTYVGSSKSISVSTEGNNLSYAWYAGESGDTSFLLSDSSSSFSPSNTVPGVYRYWVKVSNSAGFVDSIAVTYTVKSLGTGLISKHPLDSSIVVDSSVSLSVTATGSGLTYQWYSGASGDTSTPLAGKTSSSFSPTVSTVGQQSYWVRVTSGATVQNSETATVNVISRILVITEQPLDRNTYVDESFYYYTYANGSNFTYQWYAGMSGDTSNPLPNETSYSFDPPVNVAGVFHYWMRATSGGNHVSSRTAKVTVIGRKPVFTTQPQDQLLSQGNGSISLTSALDNSTGVSWQWYEGNSGNTMTPLSGKTSSTLSISNPLAGTFSYWVRATNPYGTADSRTATITVTPSLYSHWLVQNGLPANASGLGAMTASANQDGIANLLKYAMGMAAEDRFDSTNGPQMGTRVIGGNKYLTLQFIQSQNAQAAQLVVEESTNLNSWTLTPVECGPSYDNGDGTMTKTFRCSQPMNSENTGYLRLKGTAN